MADEFKFFLTIPTLRDEHRHSTIKEQYFKKPQLVSFMKADYGKCTKAPSMRYLHLPNSSAYPLDLCEGYDVHKFRKSFMYKRYLELVLDWAMSPKGRQYVEESVDKTLIYIRRGSLAKMMLSPLMLGHSMNNWILFVSRYNKNLYMCLDKEDESTVEKTPPMYHHTRLNQLLFSESQRLPPNTTNPSDDNVGYIAVHTSSMGRYNLIYSGEVQGIKAEEEIEDLNDMEALNACEYVMSKQMWQTLPYFHKFSKFSSWWVHAYLSNCKSIYVAQKARDGIVEEPIKHTIVRSIPRDYEFSPGLIIGFFHHLLEMIENLMSKIDSLETVYEFRFNSFERTVRYNAHFGNRSKIIISSDYVKFINKRNK
uniref:Decapping nuclease n=1 Tax=Glossina austeni TaxID=7395 RepID=A0A1A9UTC6_GLOAU